MDFETDTGALSFTAERLIVAGWTGRDVAGVQHHIDELAELGVPAPSTIPLYYRVAPDLLTQGDALIALGAETSGEAEPFLLKADGVIWLGLGSDHTCRGVEAYAVAHAKQACAKPVARTLWRYDEIADLDALILRAWLDEGAGWTLYQEGTLAAIRPLAELMAGADFADGDAMLCGTLPAIGGVRAGAGFRMSLTDPATDRQIQHEYKIATLPVVA